MRGTRRMYACEWGWEEKIHILYGAFVMEMREEAQSFSSPSTTQVANKNLGNKKNKTKKISRELKLIKYLRREKIKDANYQFILQSLVDCPFVYIRDKWQFFQRKQTSQEQNV